MNDQSDKSDENSGIVGGERLRKARRANDISILDVAKELHLDETKVRALEKNEFDVLGAPVFAKGHLRKYAELVGVSVDDVMTDYYQMNRSVGAPPVVGPKRKKDRADQPGGLWLGSAVLLAVLLGVSIWWLTKEDSPPVANNEPATVVPETIAPFDSRDQAAPSQEIVTPPPATLTDRDVPSPNPEAADNPDGASPAGTAGTSATTEEPVAEEEPRAQTPATVPSDDQLQIELAYSGDCWTEVSDASGQRLYYDLGRAGATISLSGDAPLRVVLGNGNNVAIKVAGRDFAIPQSSRTGRMARLTLNRPQ